jgi:lipopolysaccharide export system protein LptA
MTMVKRCLLLCLCLLASGVFALPTDTHKRLLMQAKTADIKQQKGVATFHGNVQADQGLTHLRAQSAKTFFDKKNHLKLAIAYGSHKLLAHYWTLPHLNRPLLHAYAKTIKYYPSQGKVILIGHARLQQGGNAYRAPEIIYYMKQNRIVSPQHNKGRTTIVFNKTLNKAGAPHA